MLVPDRTSLLKRPIKLGGGCRRNRTRDRSVRVGVVKDGSGGEESFSETSGHCNVVILRWLISCEENRIRLSHMNINGGICGL